MACGDPRRASTVKLYFGGSGGSIHPAILEPGSMFVARNFEMYTANVTWAVWLKNVFFGGVWRAIPPEGSKATAT